MPAGWVCRRTRATSSGRVALLDIFFAEGNEVEVANHLLVDQCLASDTADSPDKTVATGRFVAGRARKVAQYTVLIVDHAKPSGRCRQSEDFHRGVTGLYASEPLGLAANKPPASIAPTL